MHFITPATSEDIPVMVNLLQQLFSIEQDFVPNAEKQQRGLELLLENPLATILVAKTAEQQVIGMCSVQRVVSTAQGSFAAWIEDVIVAENFRHQGVATELLAAATTWAKQHGVTRLQLLVDTQNLPAMQFYERLGWRTTQLSARQFFI